MKLITMIPMVMLLALIEFALGYNTAEVKFMDRMGACKALDQWK